MFERLKGHFKNQSVENIINGRPVLLLGTMSAFLDEWEARPLGDGTRGPRCALFARHTERCGRPWRPLSGAGATLTYSAPCAPSVQKRKPAKKKKKKVEEAPGAVAAAAAAAEGDDEDSPAAQAQAATEASAAARNAIAEIVASGRKPPRGFG